MVQVAGQPCYGGAISFINTILKKFGVEVTWVKCNDIEAYSRAVKSNTKVKPNRKNISED